jgi:hypothetical protein
MDDAVTRDVENILRRASVMIGPTGAPECLRVAYPEGGGRTAAAAAERVSAIAGEVSYEFNCAFDDASSYGGDPPPPSTGYTCDAVTAVRRDLDGDLVHLRAVLAHFGDHMHLTIPVLRATLEQVGSQRYLRIDVVRCVSQGDLDSIVARLRAWFAEIGGVSPAAATTTK